MSLTAKQSRILKEFYELPKTQVVYRDTQVRDFATKIKKSADIDNLDEIKVNCPAIEHQIRKSNERGKNIQSSVFIECSYAQTLANMFGLDKFTNHLESPYNFNKNICELLERYELTPRYVYEKADGSRMLIQAGSCRSVDSALISVFNNEIFTIEFKSPHGAKLGEADLPKYDESGALKITEDFLQSYPYYGSMLNDQKDLNFIENIGNNIGFFSERSVNIVARDTYSGNDKQADVICTEDMEGYLILIPANEVEIWGDLKGEIRPAGRNSYKVWTPSMLRKTLLLKDATIKNKIVTIEKDKLELKKGRGSDEITRAKINSLFFVFISDLIEKDDKYVFNIDNVRQLNPTIAAKVFFHELKYEDVKKYYLKQLQ